MKKHFFVFLILFSCKISYSQLDSNYVVKYPDRLVISTYQSYRLFEVLINQTYIPLSDSASKMDYIAQGSNSTGIGVDWDKISFTIGWKTPSSDNDEVKKGITKTKNFALSLNAKKWRIESSYRDYQGFYDFNTPSFTANYNDSMPYYQNTELRMREFRTKGIYFRNKKNRFSYAAAYANTQRQLKSAGSFIWVANFYRSQIASPTGIINPMVKDTFYEKYDDVSKINITGLSMAPGYSLNIVLAKRIFANITLDWGLGMQVRTISQQYESKTMTDFRLSFTNGGARASLGYNGDRFFIFGFFVGDYTIYAIDKFRIEQRLVAGGLKLGYRFKFKENRLTRFLKNNRFYKML